MNLTADRFRAFENLGDAAPFVDRILALIERIAVLAAFDRSEVEALAAYLRCYRAPAGAEVIVEDEPGDFMLLLIEGDMEIVKKDYRGLPVRVGEAGPGKTLGEMSVIDGEPRFASCVTLSETVFAVLDRTHLRRVIDEQPRLGVKLLMQLLVLLNQRLRGVSVQLMKCRDDLRLPQS
ncbi:MAG: cyclic nucleotide-binding domain-containing protein [Rhodocyclales bacterium]|nr:cyclic nucleotide-binding domain-containing protein [Rhodocyclales bacterium]